MKIKTQIALILLILTAGCTSMEETVKNMYENIDVKNIKKIFEGDIKHLPDVVQKYLRHTNIIGKEKIKTVRLKQGGDFRIKPNDDFKKMKAEQYFKTESSEFYWKGKVGVITAIDKFISGKGNMIIKLLGVIKVAEVEGKQVDQGELQRFLIEGIWFPSIFTEDFISWKSLDDTTVKATITLNNISASAIFYFNEKNEISRITAKRYMEKNGKFTLEDWEIEISEYKIFNGVLIPYRSSVIWNLEEGAFCWYKPEIFQIEYNIPSIF